MSEAGIAFGSVSVSVCLSVRTKTEKKLLMGVTECGDALSFFLKNLTTL